MATRKKRPHERNVKRYVVGTGEDADFTPERIQLLAYQLARWFASDMCDRNYEDPMLEAKDIIRQCLLGQTKEGKVWSTCPAAFESRIKIKALYDMNLDQGVPSRKAKAPNATLGKNPKAVSAVNQAMRNMVPAGATTDKESYRKKIETDILREYPELDNPAHRPNVERLSLIYAEQQVISKEVMIGLTGKKREDALRQLKVLEEMAERTMKLLDIHPDSLRKKMDQQREGTLGELIAILEADDQFLEREKMWALQAALQLWYMTQHDNGRGDGPQIEPFELWHMTRSRPVDYTCECGREVTLIEGFTPEDLFQFLVKRGGLTPTTPVIPGVKEKDLEGMDKELGPDPKEEPAAEESE